MRHFMQHVGSFHLAAPITAAPQVRQAPFTLPSWSFLCAPWIWASSLSDIASPGDVWVSCAAAVNT
jgi:hypothetical protein